MTVDTPAPDLGVANILGELGEDDVDWLLASGSRQAVGPDTALVSEGVPADSLFVVLRGTLAVSTAATHETIATLAQGDVVGEVSFLDGQPPTATVRALGEAVVFVLPLAVLRAKLEVDAGFSARFHRALAVFLSRRLRTLPPYSDANAQTAPTALVPNVNLARARLERLLARLEGPRPILLTGNDLTIESVVRVAEQRATVAASAASRSRIADSRALVDELAGGTQRIYGLNVGLGALKDFVISPDESSDFQTNVLMSHAVGVGPEYEREVVRAIMLARLNGMARGGSGIQPAVFDLLLAMLNAGIHPVVPSRGSVGMSDLAPLAHLALPLIGLGEVEFQGRRSSGAEALACAGLESITLSGKDALALCGANSAAVGHGALVVARSVELLAAADIVAALSIEAFEAHVDVLDERVHEVRPYSGQLATAERLRALLAGSGLWRRQETGSVHDVLSFRCIPQVHGACQDALGYVRRTLETELNATGDNPVVLTDLGEIRPNGNFHPAGLSIAFDMLAMALAQVCSMATNRVLKLMSPRLTGLPPQLTPDPGPNCGLGVLQKTITSLSAGIRFLANNASLDFLPTADSLEDHATMTTLGVTKADELVADAQYVLAIELLCAAQALDLRQRLELGAGSKAAYEAVRDAVLFVAADRVLAPDIERLRDLIRSRQLLDNVNAVLPQRFGLDVG